MTRQEFDDIFKGLTDKEPRFKQACNKGFISDMWIDCEDMEVEDLLAAVETLQRIYKGMSREN